MQTFCLELLKDAVVKAARGQDDAIVAEMCREAQVACEKESHGRTIADDNWFSFLLHESSFTPTRKSLSRLLCLQSVIDGKFAHTKKKMEI